MAPTALVEQPVEVPVFSFDKSSKTIFPDGIKTSGQTLPDYDQIRPYSEFPKEITGPTVWKAEDYKDNPERWVHRFSEEEVQELSKAADDFLASGTPMTGITKVRRITDQNCLRRRH